MKTPKTNLRTDEEQTAPVQRRLFHAFTEEDVAALNERLAELAEKRDEYETEAQTVSAILKGAKAEIKKTLALKAAGGEERAYECPAFFDWAENRFIVRHPETGAVIENRPMTAEERQRPLFAPQAADTAAAQAEDAETAQSAACAEEWKDGAETLLDEAHAEAAGAEEKSPHAV